MVEKFRAEEHASLIADMARANAIRKGAFAYALAASGTELEPAAVDALSAEIKSVRIEYGATPEETLAAVLSYLPGEMRG